MTRGPIHDLHISNLVTYVALAASIAACVLALNESTISLAAAAIALAAIADAFDGKFARLFPRTPRQARAGMELDSLVDAIAFGAAPVIVIAAWLGPQDGIAAGGQWVAGVVYALAAITRLCFYNLQQDATAFTGIPAPAAALLCVTVLLVSPARWVTMTALLIAAALMIAPLRIPRPRGAVLAIFAAWAVTAVVLHVLRY